MVNGGQPSAEIRPGLLDAYWYYSIEVEPGRFTPGMMYGNVALTRNLLRRIAVADARCVDLGTMEALVPTLLKKRGAREVVAFDVLNQSEKVDLVKRLHKVSFQYQANMPLDRIVEFLRTKGRLEVRPPDDWRYDLTVASGLLYHLASPLPFLGYLRSITRAGGLVILETAALNRPEFDMRYCFDGERYIYGYSDTWFPSLPLLDHLLRTCRLKPLDLIYLDQGSGYPGLVRIAIVCRAMKEVVATEQEVDMAQAAVSVDFLLSMELEGDQQGPEVPFKGTASGPVIRRSTNSCDMLATVNSRAPHEPSEDEIRLRLDATD